MSVEIPGSTDRYRLVGTEIMRNVRADFTSRYLDTFTQLSNRGVMPAELACAAD